MIKFYKDTEGKTRFFNDSMKHFSFIVIDREASEADMAEHAELFAEFAGSGETSEGTAPVAAKKTSKKRVSAAS